MLNVQMLKSKMVLFRDTQKDLADALGMSIVTLQSRLSGSSYFDQREIAIIKKRYQLTPFEVDTIFFAFEVA